MATRLYKISRGLLRKWHFILRTMEGFQWGNKRLYIINCHLCCGRMDTLEVKSKEEATEPIQARDGDGEKLTPRTGLCNRQLAHIMGENGSPEVSDAAQSESKPQSWGTKRHCRDLFCAWGGRGEAAAQDRRMEDLLGC